MKKLFKILISFVFIFLLCLYFVPINANSYLADKTEIPVDLEVSGAEALCQTDDGYVWIAQYSGLTRYDSKDFETYKAFEQDGVTYDIINVRDLVTKNNVLYIATSSNLFKYEDNHFTCLKTNVGIIKEIELDTKKDILYVATETKGILMIDTKTNTLSTLDGTENRATTDIAIDYARDEIYYVSNDGIYNSKGIRIFDNSKILDIYIYKDILLIGTLDGYIYKYDLKNNKILEDKYTIGDQINKILYSESENIIFAACENNGIYCIDEETGEHNIASNLENKAQLVDLMIDYEGNLWVASHYIGASGVSIITKNVLLELLYDDSIWQTLAIPPSNDRNVYALEKHDGILYISTTSGLYFYNLENKKIESSNVVMEKIYKYIDDNIAPTIEQSLIETANKETDEEKKAKLIADIPNELEKAKRGYYDCRDIEKFNDKLYFAFYKIGLVEYDYNTNNVLIYDSEYIKNHINNAYNEPNYAVANSVRCLRAFDNYLAIGYSKGIMRYDGLKFDINNIGGNVLFINKSSSGSLVFDRTNGLYSISDDFSTVNKIKIENEVSGNSLKFLYDGDKLYYNLNSRLFCATFEDGKSNVREIIVPHVKGSIVEISKIKTIVDGKISYKYVIASQTQIYIANSLDVDILTDYDFYDSSNGVQPIIANTSGYYDEEEQKYYFQSTNGIFVYDFNETQLAAIPTKITMCSTEVDGTHYFENDIKIDKNAYRVSFNISVFGFRPHRGYSIYYKLSGINDDYTLLTEDTNTISFSNLSGGDYTFSAYVIDSNGQKSNVVTVHVIKPKLIYEYVWFWILIILLALVLIGALNFFFIHRRTKKAIERENELKGITIESIEAIARTIDAKDTYTNGHSIRVGHFSRIIAKELGYDGDELENIYYTALLHDIGKIGIPDAILNKPGRLTDEEFEIMKSHTTKGAKILADISTIPNIVEGAKYHHEKYGGGGYPEGLKGENIPYIARIICCADCFDAMATRRVYKDPYPKEKIISEFERCKEIQFDPKIADVVIRLINEGKLKAE